MHIGSWIELATDWSRQHAQEPNAVVTPATTFITARTRRARRCGTWPCSGPTRFPPTCAVTIGIPGGDPPAAVPSPLQRDGAVATGVGLRFSPVTD